MQESQTKNTNFKSYKPKFVEELVKNILQLAELRVHQTNSTYHAVAQLTNDTQI